MEFKAVTATHKLLRLNKRIRAAAGGTSASKTISILLILIDKCTVYANNGDSLLVSIVSESLPHLKRGVMRDFLNIMEAHKYFREASWNRTDFIYSFSPTVKLEFFGVDTPDKVRGPRRDILFMNEANNCPFESFEQLEVRTKQEIWLDWNPTYEFWFYTEILPYREKDLDFITLTYKDNEALPASIVDSIEARKHNTNWWRVYGEGLLGDVEGRIYSGWKIIDEIPHEARLERLGLDFGYANDPAVLVAIYFYNGGYIVDELISRTHLSNRKVADYINSSALNNVLVVADSAEPKSIAEMLEYGVQIIGAQKGPGSRNQGIQYVQDQRMSVTKKSVNVIKSYRGYMWKTDKDGKVVDIPDHAFSDEMDACFVANTKIMTDHGEKSIQHIKKGDLVLTRKGYKKVLSAGITGRNKPLYRLDTTDGQRLVGTGNHRIWANNRWKPLCDIRYADKLLTWTLSEDTKAKIITFTPTRSSFIAANTSITARSSSIDAFTKTISGLSQKVCMSIIKTMTALITALRTWSFLPTPSMVNYTGSLKNLLLRVVTNAKMIFKMRIIATQTVSAPINVRVDGVELQDLMMLRDSAGGVTHRFGLTNILPLNIVPVLAQTVQELNKKADVYNLEVEGAHEYFANGVLVHNCRYALESLRPSEDEDKVYTSGNLTKIWG